MLRHTSWRLVAGVRGDINDYWSYDVYGLYAEVSSPQVYINDFTINRILECPARRRRPERPEHLGVPLRQPPAAFPGTSSRRAA